MILGALASIQCLFEYIFFSCLVVGIWGTVYPGYSSPNFVTGLVSYSDLEIKRSANHGNIFC